MKPVAASHSSSRVQVTSTFEEASKTALTLGKKLGTVIEKKRHHKLVNVLLKGNVLQDKYAYQIYCSLRTLVLRKNVISYVCPINGHYIVLFKNFIFMGLTQIVGKYTLSNLCIIYFYMHFFTYEHYTLTLIYMIAKVTLI